MSESSPKKKRFDYAGCYQNVDRRAELERMAEVKGHAKSDIPYYTAADIASQLGKAKSTNGQWLCRCPAHDDKDPSLSVKDKPGGGVLVHCFAGCSQEDVIRVLTALGLWAPKKEPAQQERQVIYPYKDANGAKVFTVNRVDKADGSKNIWVEPRGVGDNRPLYCLPALIVDSDKPILICEGEKTVQAAQHLFPAYSVTTSSGGSSAAKKTDWTPVKGRTVTIWPDNDQPGIRYARAVKALCQAAGASAVTIVALPDGLAEHWDLADPIPDSLDVAALLATAANSVAQNNSSAFKALKDGKSEAQAKDFAVWLQEPIPAKDWLVEETFERGKMGMLVGLYESGKTTDIGFLTFALATGGEWLDRPVKQPCKVLILDLEHQAENFKAIMKPHFDVSPGYIPPAYVEYDRRPADMMQELRQKVALYKPGFIIIDNYMKCLALKRTDEAAVTEALAPYEDLAAESGAFLLWLHHNRKSKDETGAGLDFLGSVAAPGMMSVILRKEMKRNQATGEQHFYVEMTKKRWGIRFMPKTEILFREAGSRMIYQAGGRHAQQKIDQDSAVILEMLKTRGKDMTRREIVSQAKDKGVSMKRVDNALWSLTKEGTIEKTGSRGRGHSYSPKDS